MTTMAHARRSGSCAARVPDDDADLGERDVMEDGGGEGGMADSGGVRGGAEATADEAMAVAEKEGDLFNPGM